MKIKTAIVTGSGGLIGSQSVKFLIEKGYYVIGIDNDMRSYFFGDDASTKPSTTKLSNDFRGNFSHHTIDIRDYENLKNLFSDLSISINHDLDLIIHAAAQPSHDWAAKEPLTDFSINATGTVNMLELTRLYAKDATFIFTSTNKVYGDRPNFSFEQGVPDLQTGLMIEELETRYEARYPAYDNDLGAVSETMSIDACKHSVFGASKVAADIMCQEYGRYWNMNIGVFRGGCLTGPNHAGAELHGFLAYLVKCIITNKPYTIFGYKGKQVRDNIHSEDLLRMFWEFHQNPRPGEVYNAGGGRNNSTSVLEAIDTINRIAGTNWKNYTVSDEARSGDHIWYISDLSKFKSHYPEWDITISLEETIKQMVDFEKSKIKETKNEETVR
jgi:CDP-paratose 2-epimerase